MKETSPKEAYELKQSDPDCIYLDVRSVPEFEAGHAERALNIPLLHFSPGAGMSPNPDFQAVVEANLPKNARIIVGCKTGGRSAKACYIMSGMGYTDVTNLRGGFVGAMDNFGNVTAPGWSMLNLPTCAVCKEGSQYGTLAGKATKG